MNSSRLEAFSDGVFAILITIMVFGIHAPSGNHFSDLNELKPVFLTYLLSFTYLIIYWNNHHHLLKTLTFPNGWTMWANSNLLFWLSLIPFATSWLGTSGGATAPAALYGAILLMSAISFSLLSIAIIKSDDGHSSLQHALGDNLKGKISTLMYVVAIIFAFYHPLISYFILAAVAIMWVIPNSRIIDELRSDHS